MQLSQREIRDRAIDFIREWAEESREKAEAQTFWNEFFQVFGITRRRVASFEEPVNKLAARKGSIDLFWKGMLIAEHKSKGASLNKAYNQALDYFPGIPEYELPKYIIVSDFATIRLYDLEENTEVEFPLAELPNRINLFYFISGYKKRIPHPEDPVNVEAAERMGLLHDLLKDSGFSGHPLEVFLVRVVYCLFADDTGIFPKDQFEYLLETKSPPSGDGTGALLATIFQVLNTPVGSRQAYLDEELQQLPYVDGALFSEVLPIAAFSTRMRDTLLNCCKFDWSKVSPAIFGSMFQSVMDQKVRRNLGAHYTSEKNILKVVKSLFLDELQQEYEEARNSAARLKQLHMKISALRFFDPACGCGNFLAISYRELRLLEMHILLDLRKLAGPAGKQLVIDVSHLSLINVDCLTGIEIEEFPARVAEVALWLTDHQMNMLLSFEFGQSVVRLPLQARANIIIGNALKLDWEKVVDSEALHDAQTRLYILGNPPFVGKKARSPQQNNDMELVMKSVQNYGILDYVSAWYVKAFALISDTSCRVAFVSTNSITQGEQVSVLWIFLLKAGMRIGFAHRTFRWSNEASKVAQVFCVIIGFSCTDSRKKYLFDYERPESEPMRIEVNAINPYLVDFEDLLIPSRTEPICKVPEMIFGSMPNDDGNLLLTDDGRTELIKAEPKAASLIRPLTSAHEYMHGERRWCIWLADVEPGQIRSMPEILNRIQAVKKYRSDSKRAATRKLAETPTLFGEIRQPNSDYVLIPRHSSENRRYVPFSFFSKNVIAHDSCLTIPNASLYDFGVISSSMHMAWMRQICGRIKSDYRYSAKLVYNNFPWPDAVTSTKKRDVENAARAIIQERKNHSKSTLADLYDPLTMPKSLLMIHKQLDSAVEACYRATFSSDLGRLRHLFNLYRKYIEPLTHSRKRRLIRKSG